MRWQTSSLILFYYGSNDPFHNLDFTAILKPLPRHFTPVLDKFLAPSAERCWKMAVDVEFAGDLIRHKNRHNNL